MKYTWTELIKYLVSFFFGRRKEKSVERKDRFEKMHKKFESEYNKIDKKKEKNKSKDIEKRLNNLF